MGFWLNDNDELAVTMMNVGKHSGAISANGIQKASKSLELAIKKKSDTVLVLTMPNVSWTKSANRQMEEMAKKHGATVIATGGSLIVVTTRNQK